MNCRLYLTLLIIMSLAACAPPAPTDVDALRAAIVARYPTVDGSTSTHPLQRTLACDLLGAPCMWSASAAENVERTFIPDPDADIPGQTAQAILNLKHNGTHGAYVNLIDGKADVILVARAPSADELQEAESKNVQLDARPAALDAFVFLVNVQNPVEALPLATLRDVYAGKITTWREAGVEPGEGQALIQAYQRERNSGSQELMMQLVMQGTPMIESPNMIVETMLGPFNAIGGHPLTGGGDTLGLGYSVYYYAAVMFAHQQVKIIGVDGVKPTAETIGSHAYPLVAEVYMVTRGDTAPDSPAGLFRDWLLSADGQRAVGRSGYVPLVK